MKSCFFLYISILIVFLSTFKRTTETLQQDAVYKFIQILDWKHQNYETFQRYIPENSIDKEKEFQIYKPPFVYKKNKNQEYLVFPWLFNVLTTPFYLFFNFFGLILLPILFGILSIWAFRKVLEQIPVSNEIKILSCYFYILCTPLIVYSTTLYEANLCNFLLYFSLYLFLKNQQKKQKQLYFLICGIMIGTLIFFRAEVFFLGNLFILFFILKNLRQNAKQIFPYSLGILIVLTLFTTSNKLFFDSYLPLRAISISGYSIGYRFLRVLDYITLKPYSFLFYFPLCFSSLYFLFSKDKKKYFEFLAPTWLFFFILPIIAPQQQGQDTTPRFFFPIVPFLGVFTLNWIETKLHKQRKWIYTYIFVHSASFILAMMFFFRVANLSAAHFKKKITPFLVQHNVFQSNAFTLFSFYQDREKNYYLVETVDNNQRFLNQLKEKKQKARFFFAKRFKNEVIDFNLKSLKKIHEDDFIYVFETF